MFVKRKTSLERRQGQIRFAGHPLLYRYCTFHDTRACRMFSTDTTNAVSAWTDGASAVLHQAGIEKDDCSTVAHACTRQVTFVVLR